MRITNSLLSGIGLGVFIAGAVFVAAERFDWSAILTTADASIPPAQPAAPRVDVVEVESRSVINWDEYTGRFQAIDEVEIRARVSGYLEGVHFEDGHIVEEGDLLFTIDPRPFEAALAEADAEVIEAEASVQLANSELERARTLLGQGHVSEAVFDNRQQEADAANATLAAAKARSERARLDLGFTRIYAPVTGRISDDATSPGNLIEGGSGSEALTTIVSLDPIHFVFDATEQQYLEYVRSAEAEGLRDEVADAPAYVRLIDEPEFTHRGRIDFVDNRIDRSTGTIRGRAVLSNSDGIFTPGMFGRLRLANGEETPTVLIPEQAIGSDQTQKFVWVVGDDNTVSRRAVTLGNREDGLRIVAQGLEAGERVVVSGLHRVAEGVSVTPVIQQVTVAERQ